MLYSLKEETGHERPKAQIKIKKYKLRANTHPLTLPTTWYESTSPHLSQPTIIHNNNTMDTEFLVQIRQSNKCGSVRNDEIFNLHLGSGAVPWVSIPCLAQDTSHIYWFHPPKQLITKKQRTQKWDSTPKQPPPPPPKKKKTKGYYRLYK